MCPRGWKGACMNIAGHAPEYTCSMAGRRIRSFLSLAFGITWAIAGAGALVGVDTAHPAYTATAALCMLGPAFAALIQWRLIDRAPWSAVGLHPSRIRWRGLGFTVLLGVCIIPMCLAVVYLFGDRLGMASFGHAEVSGARFAERVADILEERGVTGGLTAMPQVAAMPGGILLLGLLTAAVLAAFTVNLPFMLGEELGWRGYLFAATSAWSPAKRVLFTGPVWGVWHAPLIVMGHNYPGHPVVGILLMVVFCTLLAVLFDHTRTRAGSVWAACVLHGLINGSAGAFMLFAWGGHVLVASPAGIAGAMAIAILCIVVFAVDASYRRIFFLQPIPITDTPEEIRT